MTTNSRAACSRCGMPYHRYSPEDPEHDADATACINSMDARIEELEAENERLRKLAYVTVPLPKFLRRLVDGYK